MKRCASCVLVFVLMLCTLMGLTSCSENNEWDHALYAEILKVDKAASVSDDFVIRIWISDSEEFYSSSDITIQLSKGPISFVDADADGVIKAKYTDFSVKKNAKIAYKDYTIKYSGPEISDGCAFGFVKVNMSLETNSGVIDKISNYIGFAALGDYIAFGNNDIDSYISICKKLPGWENLQAASYNPLRYTITPVSVFVSTYNDVYATIESLEHVPVGNRFDIDIGFIAEHKNRKNGVLKVEADGFSIFDASGKNYDSRYEVNYTDLDTEKYGFSGGLERGDGYKVYRTLAFDYTEELSFICEDMTEHSGKIHISFSTDEETVCVEGYADLDIYYATDGKNIAYSIESEDAAKRELYGKVGYFFKVTVPEYFNDLSGGCD